jgi:glycosyltransferase involved in cell wall biosynthesis
VISFVVPAYNEERLLGATLEAIHRAARELAIDYEIVVANDGSTDATAQVAAAHGAIVVEVHHRKISASRNSGAAAARGDRLVFVDADTQIDARVLAAALAALDAGAVGGGAQVTFPADAPPWVHTGARAVIGFMRLWNWAAGCFIFCHRADFEAVGGFDERHYAAEEIMLSRELKRRGRFVILRETVTTSPRKFEARSAGKTIWLTIRLVARGFRGTRDRRHTDFWYDGKR